jgi:hypothetical protein
MEASKIVKLCDDYFSGFEDVKKHENACQTFKGVLKIFTYLLVIPLAVFGLLSWKYRKIAFIDTNLDKLMDTDAAKPHFVGYQKIGTDSAIYENQKALIDYLVMKLDSNSENPELEIERFQKGFRILDFESQKTFFEKISSFDKALTILPRDLKILNFYSGKVDAFHHSKTSSENTTLLIKVLPEFKELRRLNLDLKGVGFICPSVNASLQDMIGQKEGVNIYHGLPHVAINWNGMKCNHVNDAETVVSAMTAMRTLIRENKNKQKDFMYNISFTNLAVSHNGVSQHGGVYPDDDKFDLTAACFLAS